MIGHERIPGFQDFRVSRVSKQDSISGARYSTGLSLICQGKHRYQHCNPALSQWLPWVKVRLFGSLLMTKPLTTVIHSHHSPNSHDFQTESVRFRFFMLLGARTVAVQFCQLRTARSARTGRAVRKDLSVTRTRTGSCCSMFCMF